MASFLMTSLSGLAQDRDVRIFVYDENGELFRSDKHIARCEVYDINDMSKPLKTDFTSSASSVGGSIKDATTSNIVKAKVWLSEIDVKNGQANPIRDLDETWIEVDLSKQQEMKPSQIENHGISIVTVTSKVKAGVNLDGTPKYKEVKEVIDLHDPKTPTVMPKYAKGKVNVKVKSQEWPKGE